MQYNDIVNRDIYNLKNCDEEPIHIPGSIQPHGCLFVIEKSDRKITFCSGNVDEYLGISHTQMLDKEVGEVFEPAFIEAVMNDKYVLERKRNVLQRNIGGREFSVTIHSNNGYVVVECEPAEANDDNSNDLYSSSRQLLSYIEDSYTLQQLCAVVANAIKNITGYDRVMVYRFDNEYNGEVIAESKEEHLESFFGLHYPHTDIPVQARELYIKNQLRIIGNVVYEPVPIYTTKKGAAHDSLDLSLSMLRSVSPIHLQYLQNMGVAATLTISLLHRGKLWGLIACHHYSPKYISSGVRLSAKLHGHFITSQIDVRLMNEEYGMIKATRKACEEITSMKLPLSEASIKQIIEQENILELCNAAGVSVLVAGDVYTYGKTPCEEHVRMLAEYLSAYTGDKELATDRLGAISPELKPVADTLPGIYYLSFGFEAHDCIIWYREETITQVDWAGDPAKAIEKDRNGLSPRKSFMLWREIVKGKSNPWLPYELEVCQTFFRFFQNHLRSIMLYNEHEKQKEISRILQETNAELENINWISTHDLQEPLRKIRMMSSMILSDDLQHTPQDLHMLVTRMNVSAERMQTMIHDILSYTRIKGEDVFEPVNPAELLQGILADMAETIEEQKATITIAELPVINGIPFLLKQLFSNLLNNSFKFRDAQRPPHIIISATEAAAPGYITIRYADNGIGFRNEHSEKIFDVFARLHTKDKYAGSGIGLALCRKIMTRHNGKITASGKEGQGAIFDMSFPHPGTI